MTAARQEGPVAGAIMAAMWSCEQSPGVSVLDHGVSVRTRYPDLGGRALKGQPLLTGWPMPTWALEAETCASLPGEAVMKENQVHHNCGKPEVLKTDTGRRMYFPGHVAVSVHTCLAARGSPEAAAIMAIDANLLKAGVVREFVDRPQADAPFLTALAEVHSKAAIFRGTDSESFKIKAKNLDKRGSQVIRAIRYGCPTKERNAP